MKRISKRVVEPESVSAIPRSQHAKYCERTLIGQGLVAVALEGEGMTREEILNRIAASAHSANYESPYVHMSPSLAMAWADSGFPRIEPSHKLAASLMATTMPSECIDGLQLPWRAFGVSIPAGLLSSEECFALFAATRDNGFWMFASVPHGIEVGVEPTLADFARTFEERGATFRNGIDGEPIYSHSEEFREFPAVHVELIGRLIVGVIAEMGHRPSLPRPSSASACKTLRETDDGHFKGKTFKLVRNVKVDVRRAIFEYATGRTTNSPSVRTLVRGHWKRQPIGVGRVERKMIHVEPYWRGPDDAPIALRSHVLSGAPR